jgi:hypothetical protein
VESARIRPEYQREPKELARVALERGNLTGLEVLRIAAWKSARGLAALTLNTEAEFEAVTGSAIQTIAQLSGRSALESAADNEYWDEWREVAGNAAGEWRKTGLMKLRGIDYPMASAILAIIDPEVWPVLDRWACLTVFGPTAISGRQLRRPFRTKTAYAAYARHLVLHGKEAWPHAETIHDLDQLAMNASISNNALAPAGLPRKWTYATL